MKEIKEKLDILEKMSEIEINEFKETLKNRNDLDEILMLIADDYMDASEEYDVENDNNAYVLLAQYIVNETQKKICKDIDGVEFSDLTKDCQIDLIDNIIPEDHFKEYFLEGLRNEHEEQENKHYILDENKKLTIKKTK